MNHLNRNLSSDELIGIGLFISSIILLIILTYFGLNQSLWEDEIYTLDIVSKSFTDMVFTTAGNVHPPLYYIILMLAFKFSSWFSINNIVFAKLVSVIPLVLLLCFSFFRLRRDLGWLVTGIFGFCIITMPKLMIYGTQIRMYSWVMFFVTLSFYYSYKITKESNNRNWIIFNSFSLLAVYTHELQENSLKLLK
ncbi:MAG: glycosyltransferase family 39 protein [Methanobrevibacter sp.]|nr:glycosyltransferase family 39 protein [Candidatus Methanovirga basalitermitum]